MKKCGCCKEFLPLDMFHNSSKYSDGKRETCKKCRAKQSNSYRNDRREHVLELERKRRERNRAKIRLNNKKYNDKVKTKDKRFAYRLEHVYGITLDIYLDMLEQQDNSCAICKIKSEELPKRLCVDHCHTTGKVRGLLCDKCNRMLGQINDRVEVLEEAIKYILKNREKLD